MMLLYNISPLLLAGAARLEVFTVVMLTAATVVAAAVLVYNRIIVHRARYGSEHTLAAQQVMEKALEIAASNVIVYDLYTLRVTPLSGTMLPEGGVDEATFRRHVHPDDLDMVIGGIRDLKSGRRQSVEFVYRWNFNFGGGEPRWGYLRNTSVAEYEPDGRQPVSIISTLVDETRQRQQQEQEELLSSRYRLIFEHSIIGLSFYTPDGWLLDANRIMREICHFDSDEGDSFFGSTNLFDVPPFNEVLDRNCVEEFWACHQSIIPERAMRLYLEIHLHPIYDGDKLTYLAISTRDVTEEREIYMQAKRNDLQLQRANEAIQLYESELQYMMEACDMLSWRSSFADNSITFFKRIDKPERTMRLTDLAPYFVDDVAGAASRLGNPMQAYDRPLSRLCHMRSLFHHTDELVWIQINSIPVYDGDGRLTGGFGLVRNVTAMMQKQEQLRHETERANDSGRLKSVFLANMTHEIRTPLNAIVGFSDLLQAIEDSDERREMLRIIHNNCDMLLRLINDILVLSNVDANAMQIMPERVDFAHEFSDICQSLSQRVSEPAVQFVIDNPCPQLYISIDKARIQQVITNFVTNAVKYTREGHIRVGYRVETGSDGGRFLYVYCEDTGSGIPADQCSRVFERFVKLNDFVQGTGLGLSICKAIIDKCGGQIGVDSQEGSGSTFWFRIPVEVG